MKHVLFAVLVLFTLTTGCRKVYPDGPAIKQVRNVSGFDKIEAGISGNIRFLQGPVSKVEVEAAENIQSYIITEVKGNKLIMKTQPNVNIRGGSVNIYITNPTLTGATLAGSGNIQFESEIATNTLELKLSGSGNISMPALSANTLFSSITGSGNLSINGGTVTKQEIIITGHGDYETRQMQSEESKINLTGSGSAKLWANSKLEVTITGSGDVWYLGTPTINTSITGSGKVRKL
ncbi:MAG TPA: head GIN domain-containing protein [Niabella sp.]|nr:head GIN domain-containing protein [Niabella sp.]HOZ95593.1 head GIN domain-containing protein [Niabella sp.]HQW13833.1 head GIN domain-containing protein [Niabella sp.]HQX19274.1 head GIN domain-containing protein [Niabella sp.]HQX42117.1 head GIN domain-containing protein [Niabella sp.]